MDGRTAGSSTDGLSSVGGATRVSQTREKNFERRTSLAFLSHGGSTSIHSQPRCSNSYSKRRGTIDVYATTELTEFYSRRKTKRRFVNISATCLRWAAVAS